MEAAGRNMCSAKQFRPLIIKLGGSVITDKASEGVINTKVLGELAEVLASVTGPLVIIHGAGSLGHPEAKRWGIADGVTAENAEGVYETHEAVSRLNEAVVAALRSAGINAVPFPPFASALTENRRIVYAGEEQIKELLSAGIVPVLYGDVAADKTQGACILSGDQIAPYLAAALGAERIGFVTASGGVLQDGTVVPEISRKTADSVAFFNADRADVTGGMKGKIAELLLLAEFGIESQIFAAEDLAAFLSGENPGTRIKL